MARVTVESYMVRYPLGGMMSWILQHLVGFRRLGHDVYFVEKSDYANACFDPETMAMTDDCTYGVRVVGATLSDVGLAEKWCFVDASGQYHGLSRRDIEDVFRSTDVFIQMAPGAAWLEEASHAGATVLIDGDPGFRQIWMTQSKDASVAGPEYDFYFTTGRNIGTSQSSSPTAGVNWRPLFPPVVVDLFEPVSQGRNAPFTTVMNWRSYDPVRRADVPYGQKDAEFEKFMDLPQLTTARLEVAVAGGDVPVERLRRSGWSLRDAITVTMSFESFKRYIDGSLGEFSVCKQGYVATNSGWFSDRSSAYLASGRPVVLQETGFSSHLPCGEGLFAVRTPDEAARAIDLICADYERHAKAAREIALEYLDARRVLGGMLEEIGL